ncbi:MAG: DUF420 domain-containing protein [Haloarculaceae archaeon]
MPIDADRHRRVLLASGGLSALALALVFGAVLGSIPASLLPRAPDAVLAAIPHANALLVAVAFVVVAWGWRQIRAGAVRRHRRAMLAGLALFGTFLVLYLYRIVLVGTTGFEGSTLIRNVLYLPMLGVHTLLAIVCIPLLTYVATLGVTVPTREVPTTPHPRVGRVAVVLWLVSFALGVGVYVLLYWL